MKVLVKNGFFPNEQVTPLVYPGGYGNMLNQEEQEETEEDKAENNNAEN